MTTIGDLLIYDPEFAEVYDLGFFNINFPGGWPYDILQNQVQPVTGMGVNSTRMRVLRQDFERFHLLGWTEADTFDDAVSIGTAIKGYTGFVASLSFTAAGVLYDPTDYLYIWSVRAIPAPCDLVSTIASYDSTAMVMTDLELQFVR